MKALTCLLKFTKGKISSLLAAYGLFKNTKKSLRGIRGSLCVDRHGWIVIFVGKKHYVVLLKDVFGKTCPSCYTYETVEYWNGKFYNEDGKRM